MENKDINLKSEFSIWWSFFWRYTIMTIFLSWLSGLVGGYIVAKLGYPEHTSFIKTVLLLFTMILASFLALRITLSTQFNRYSISCVKKN